jgi:hypothetical protein
MLRCVLAVLATWVLISCGGGDGNGGVTAAGAASAAEPLALLPLSATAKHNKALALLAGEVSLVNVATPGNEQLRAIGATSDGGYVVAWLGAGPTLFIRPYNSAGKAAGDQVGLQVNFAARTPTDAAQAIGQASVAVLADGTVIVLYRISRDVVASGGFAGSSTGLYFQRFDLRGVPRGPETQVAVQADAGLKSPFISQATAVALPGGGFVTAWTVAHFSTRFASVSTLGLRWFDSAGAAVGSPTEVGTFPELTFDVVSDSHDGVTLSMVWTDNFDGRESDVLHYDASHVFLEVVTPTLRQVVLLPLQHGYVLFALDTSGATEQLLDAQGVLLGAPMPIPSLPASARELADGTYVTLRPSGNGAFTVEWYAAGMTPLEAQLAIGSRGVLPQLAALADPGFAVAWTGLSANPGTDVYTQSFRESGGNMKKACLDSAKQQKLNGHARKDFIEACMA